MYYFSVCTLPNLNAYLHVFTAVSQSVSMTEACENYICSTKNVNHKGWNSGFHDIWYLSWRKVKITWILISIMNLDKLKCFHCQEHSMKGNFFREHWCVCPENIHPIFCQCFLPWLQFCFCFCVDTGVYPFFLDCDCLNCSGLIPKHLISVTYEKPL